MAIRIRFDSNHNVIPPSFILATRNGSKLGAIPHNDIVFKNPLSSCKDLVFRVYKELNGVEFDLWDQLVDFKLMWCRDWDLWFELTVELDHSNELIKNVTAKSLGEAELSQINVYDTEINTELDISRDDYVPTVLYDSGNPKASMLDRIMEKAPHYKIKHVDASIAGIQRIFKFDGKSIYDIYQEIAQEINCLFVIDSGTDDDGKIARSVSVYDLESYCPECGYRDEFIDCCPKCGNKDILSGYGEDTSIFVSTDNLADKITYSSNVGSVKNCFKLEAGDDLMTATLVNCNPNGSGYIWYISEDLKKDMSDELVFKINEYDEQYNYYQNEYKMNISGSIVTKYNALVDKYSAYSNELEKIPDGIVGYPALMNAYYDTIDFHLFLNSGLMPDVSLQETTASKQAAKLTRVNLSPIAVSSLDICSTATATSTVLSMAKVLIDPRYQVKVNDGVLDGTTWTGSFTVTNYSDEEDTATSPVISVTVNEDYEQFVEQKLEKALDKTVEDSTDIVSLFKLDSSKFTAEIKKYCLSRLVSFHDACQACLDILIEQGIADKAAWEDEDPNLYNELYVPYYQKLGLLEDEIKVRESEIAIIIGTYNSNGELTADGIQSIIERERDYIQSILDFEDFIGEELWLEFAAYRREDTYQNENYISDGLNNAELFANAIAFIETAKKDIFKSATLQHSITATLQNLLVMKEFAPIIDYFEVGNWIRVKVDNNIYRLRLIDYEINFNDLKNIQITFSDVKAVSTGVSDIESVLNQAASMSTSYGAVAKQAEQGKDSNDRLNNWVAKGLDLTNMKIVSSADNQNIVWDNHGMLFREYDDITDTYDDCQLKIINSTLSITDDNWETVKTAVGKYYYLDPETGNMTLAYGVNAETLVGKLLLGEQLGIYNTSGSLSFDTDGFVITNGTNTFMVNPNPDQSDGKLLSISNESTSDIFYVDKNGSINIDSNNLSISNDSNSLVFDGSGFSVSNGTNTFRVSPSEDIMFIVSNASKDVLYIDTDGKLNIDSDNVVFSNDSNSLVINNNGLSISNGTNTFSVNPNSDKLLCISNKNEDVLYVDANGSLYIVGDGSQLSIGENTTIKDLYCRIAVIEGDESGLDNLRTEFSSEIEQSAKSIKATVSQSMSKYDIEDYEVNLYGYGAPDSEDNGYAARDYSSKYYLDQSTGDLYYSDGESWAVEKTLTLITDGLSSQITQTADNIRLEVNEKIDGVTAQYTTLEQKVDSIKLEVSTKDGVSTISLTGEGITASSASINMSGYVTFSSLETEGETSINGSNITTGTLNAEYVNLCGKFNVWSDSSGAQGGYIGYMTGNVSGIPIDGIGVSDENNTHYLIATGAGVRMQAEDTNFYVSDSKIGASMEITVASDRNVKNDISYDMVKYEEFYKSLKPATFKYNYGGNFIHTGFIAQDVHDALALNGLSVDDFAGLSIPAEDHEIYGIAYTSFVSLNTYMIQKLLERVAVLEKINGLTT